MQNDFIDQERKIRTLQDRVAELERELAEAQAAILSFSTGKHSTPAGDAGQSAEELYAIIQALHHPVMVYDQTGVVYLANASAARAHGFDPTRHHRQETNQTLIVRYQNGEIAHSEELPSARALRGETVIDEPLTITNSRGQELDILVTSSPLVVNGALKGAVSVWHDITERRRAEDALRLSEARYRSLVETAFEGIWTVDPSGRTTFVNRRMAEMLKYDSPLDLMDRSAFDFVPPEDLAEVRARFRERLRKNNPEQYDVRLRCRDGSILWTSVASSNMLNDNGTPTGRVALFLDITERKEAEEKLRSAAEEAAWLARLPGENPNPIVRVSSAGMVLYCNLPAASLRGWRCVPDARLSNPLLDLVEQAAEQGQVVTQDVALGDKIYLVSAVPIAGESYLNLYGTDITERKQAEKSLAESERRQREITRLLELDQARLAAILQHLPVGVWIVDQEGRVVGNNRQADEIWAGNSPAVHNIADYNKYAAWHPETGERLEPEQYPVAQALRTGKAVEPVELNIRRFDGSEGTVLVSAVPIKDQQGHLTGVIGVNVDITQRKRVEQALREAEIKYRTLVENIPSAVTYMTSPDPAIGTFYVSPQIETMLGYTPEEWQADPGSWREHIHPEDRERLLASDAIHKTSGSLFSLEYRMLARDGHTVWVRDDAVMIREETGRAQFSQGIMIDITARKQAEEALSASRQRINDILTSLGDGLLALDREWSIIYVNQHAARIAGRSEEELIGKNLWELWPQLLGTPLERSYRQAMEHRIPGQFRTQGDLSRRWYDVSVYPSSEGITIFYVDKTEQILAEERFNKAFHASPDAIVISRQEDGRIETVNQTFLNFFGYREPEVLGRTSTELGMFANSVNRQEAIQKLKTDGSVRDFELDVRLKSGEMRNVNLSIEMLSIGGQNLMLTTLQDITLRKRAEAALRESVERFHSLADSMPQLVWTALPDGTVDYYNQRYREYREITELEGAVWEWAPVLHPDDLSPTVDAWQQALATGEMYQIEHRVRMADGSYRWHLSRGIPVRGEKGAILRWFGTATDIHDLKLAEEQLRNYSERLERSNRELEQFAFIASHDLQEPLRKIEMFGNLLLDRSAGLQEHERNYLDRIRSAAGRMRDMVEGLLQLSRVTTQGQPFVPVDLSQITMEVLHDLEAQIRRGNGEVDLGRLPAVDGDPLQLRQLMQNLISNALKYHQPDMPPRVRIYSTTVEKTIHIHVEDQGIGFDQDDAELIFQPFHRLVGRSQYEGSGIGLAICRRIVERHGGEITAFSKPGRGTIFTVTLRAPVHAMQEAGEEQWKP